MPFHLKYRLLYQIDASDIGCEASDVHEVITRLKGSAQGKRIRAVRDWAWCDICDAAVSTDNGDEAEKVFFPSFSFLLAGKVIYDDGDANSLLGRCIQTTNLVNFYDASVFETKNTIYVLVEPGIRLVFLDPELIPRHLLN